MPTHDRLLSLAAGTLRDADRCEAIDAAAAAGFGAVGLRFDLDAPAQAPSSEPEALAHEARHARLLPGDGALPLHALVEHLSPQAPLSVEVQSDALAQRLDPRARAHAAGASARRVLDATGSGC